MANQSKSIRYNATRTAVRYLAGLTVPTAGLFGWKLWTTYAEFHADRYFSQLPPLLKVFECILLYGALVFCILVVGMVRRALNPSYIDIDASGISLTDLGKTERHEWSDLSKPELSSYQTIGMGGASYIKMRNSKNGENIVITLNYYPDNANLVNDIFAAYGGQPFGSITHLPPDIMKQRAKIWRQATGVVGGVAVGLIFAGMRLISHHS